jgi:8-oxo-dGTP pyrophosphatase MutT (NUDIX family)
MTPYTSNNGAAARQLIEIADELRAMSNNALRYTEDVYEIDRLHRILELSAQLMSFVDAQPLEEIRKQLFADLDYVTPLAVVDTAVFDEAGRLLLIRRADNKLWAMPGGACDVGEPPAAAAAREVWEETGYIVEIDDFLGVFDSRLSDSTQNRHHLYMMLFAGHITGGTGILTHETVDLRWFPPDEIPWDELAGSHATRIRRALSWRANPQIGTYFDRVEWRPSPTRHHPQQ